MNQYEPELGQALFGNPTGHYDMPPYADALLAGLLDDIDTVFWNREQRQWERHEDPKIPGVEYRSYWWGDEEAPEASLPNFKFGDIEIRWYKHPGRGTSVQRPVSAQEWADWHDAAHAAIWAASPRPGEPKRD